MKNFQLTPDKVKDYIEEHSTPPGELLHQLERYTFLNTLSPVMISGNFQGQLLKMFSQMIRPERVLEVGTFTGYSAICLAAGIKEGGTLDTIEANPEMESIILKYVKQASIQNIVNLHIGDALDILPGLAGPYDLVFLDANKEQYCDYYDIIFPKVKSGGFILADNVLWYGRVLAEKMRRDAEEVDRFNKKIQADDRVENLMLPIIDGISIIRKK